MDYLIIHTVQCTSKDCSPIQNLFGSSYQPERNGEVGGGGGEKQTDRQRLRVKWGKKRWGVVGGGSPGAQLISTNKSILLVKEEWQAVA